MNYLERSHVIKHFSLIEKHFTTNSKLFLKAAGKLIQHITIQFCSIYNFEHQIGWIDEAT